MSLNRCNEEEEGEGQEEEGQPQTHFKMIEQRTNQCTTSTVNTSTLL